MSLLSFFFFFVSVFLFSVFYFLFYIEKGEKGNGKNFRILFGMTLITPGAQGRKKSPTGGLKSLIPFVELTHRIISTVGQDG